MENGEEHGDEQIETEEPNIEHEHEKEQEEAPNDEPMQSHMHESNGEHMVQSAADITNANITKDEQVSFFRQMDSKHRHTKYC